MSEHLVQTPFVKDVCAWKRTNVRLQGALADAAICKLAVATIGSLACLTLHHVMESHACVCVCVCM